MFWSREQTSHFETYLQRTHRRWVFWRMVEWVGLSIAIGCAVALVLSLILMVRGESALQLDVGCIVIGAACGTMIGWIRRPSISNTAGEIDRQFHLADLLGTALAIRQARTFVADAQDQSWSATVLGLAEARSVELAHQSLVLRRYGSRAWGGIGLATATVLTLGVLSGNPMMSRAGNFASQSGAVNAIRSPQMALNSDVHPPQIPLENRVESRDASRMDLRQPPVASSTADGDSMHQSNTALDNSGAGIGQTAVSPHREKIPLGHSDVQNRNSSGQTAAGGAEGANDASSGNANANAANSNAHQPASEWSSNNAAVTSKGGNQDVQSDSVPDAYRDLVKDYFQRN